MGSEMCIRDRFGDVFCEQGAFTLEESRRVLLACREHGLRLRIHAEEFTHCLLYTSDAAGERSSVDLGGRRIIKTKKNAERRRWGESKEYRQ